MGNTARFEELLDAYPWDFCMIQYNYLDENSQAGRKGLQYAAKKRIPVMIMEPLRGGKLVELLPEKAKQMVADHYTHRTAAEWSFRWLWDQPEITAVLSGMNSIEMIRENCRIASEMSPGSFLKEDFAFIESIKKEINQSMKVGCTGCGYCMPCPKGVDIPMAFSSYNRIYSEGKGAAQKRIYAVYPDAPQSYQRFPLRGMRQVRAALSPGDPNTRGAEKGGRRAGNSEIQSIRENNPYI